MDAILSDLYILFYSVSVGQSTAILVQYQKSKGYFFSIKAHVTLQLDGVGGRWGGGNASLLSCVLIHLNIYGSYSMRGNYITGGGRMDASHCIHFHVQIGHCSGDIKTLLEIMASKLAW